MNSFSWKLFSLISITHHSLLLHAHAPPTTLINVTKNLYFPNFKTKDANIKLLGNAIISKHDSIQIPNPKTLPDLTNQAGRAIYASPVRLLDPHTHSPASFNTTFAFQFTKTLSYQDRGGHGLAFIIVPDEFTLGRPGPWLGFLNDACHSYKTFAVEFDNSYDPTFGDPNDDHIGINLGSIVSTKTANSSNISLHDDLIHRAWIIYNGNKKLLDVYLGSDSNPMPTQPILSYSLDLSPFLKEYMFVGFSSATGENISQIHNILSWNFSSTVQAHLNPPSTHTCHNNIAYQVAKISVSTNYYANPPSNFLIFICLISLSAISFLNLYLNRNKHDTNASKVVALIPRKPCKFKISELYKATRRFSASEIISSDSRGVLYRVTLPNGSYLAAKRFSVGILNSSQVNWTRILKNIAEINDLSHPKLARIRGWCYDNGIAILVYDYFPNGTMEKWLFGLGVLPWNRRFEFVKDIAEALTFLHSENLFHGNLSINSVFLDMNYRAVLGDYGFVFSRRKSREEKPEQKADVFNFGVLMLQIISGKRREEIGNLGFDWEKEKLIDQRIGSSVKWDEAIRAVEVALMCTNEGRPSMEEVMQFLNMKNPVSELPPVRSAGMLTEKS